MEIFVRLAGQDPTDVEARVWVARLELRLGRLAEAEAGFRSVLREHPEDVDVRIGLASVLIRRGKLEEALAILTVYRHSLAFEGFTQGGAPGAGVQSGSIGAGIRVAPRLRIDAIGRMQQGTGYSDALGGGGLVWRAARSTTAELHALGGPDNLALPTTDLSAGLTHYAGAFEIGGGVRRFAFPSERILAAFPQFAWDPGGRWRLDMRYIYTRSVFDRSGQSRGDHSVMVRETWLARFQIVEYMRSFLLFRIACASRNGVTIISGAFGLFRRNAAVEVGGYDPTAIGEDMDLTLRLQTFYRLRRRPARIAFIPLPMCWTQAPEDLASPRSQRCRWRRGLLQVLWRHRRAIGNPRLGHAPLRAPQRHRDAAVRSGA